MAVTYSVRISGGGIDSFLGFEYGDVITLASREFRVLLPILPSLRFFAHFWLRRGRMVLRPPPSCLTSRFTHVRSLYWVLGCFGVRQGYGCVGIDRCDDYSADSSASLAQYCCCGGFFPSFAIFALVGVFSGILAFIPRLHFWCCLFCSSCLFSSLSLLR